MRLSRLLEHLQLKDTFMLPFQTRMDMWWVVTLWETWKFLPQLRLLLETVICCHLAEKWTMQLVLMSLSWPRSSEICNHLQISYTNNIDNCNYHPYYLLYVQTWKFMWFQNKDIVYFCARFQGQCSYNNSYITGQQIFISKKISFFWISHTS